MLHGPPGTGKSTMARVIAKQCGYVPKEVNASDCRSGADICEVIKNALEMNQVSFENGKPTCLILDEIDGALGGSNMAGGLKMVADFLQKSLKIALIPKRKRKFEKGDVDMEDEEKQTPTKKGKRNEHPPLIRPIIMICN